MTHETQGKRWPPTAGVEADFITVETNGCGALAAERLRLHGIPHTTVFVGPTGRSARMPPVLEGWSFSVYNGAEEHASGWGSATLADMAPALLAAIGMTDAATANRRAQVAEQRAAHHAADRDGAVEALDIANDMIGKLCAVMAGAGFDGDLLSAVGDLIESRNNAIKSRDSKQRELVEVRDALGPSRTADTVSVLAKRMRASLNRWEAVTRELAAGNPMLAVAVSVEDLADRHFDLRFALMSEVDSLRRELVSAHDQIRDISRILGPRRTEHDLPSAKAIRLRSEEIGCLRGLLDKQATSAATWEAEARKAWAYGEQIGRVLPAGGPNDGLLERAVTLACEADRLRDQVATLQEQNEAGWAESRRGNKVLDAVRKSLETPVGESIVEHAAKVYKNSECADRMTEEVARLSRMLETPKDTSVVEHASQVLHRAKAIDAWQTWGRNKIGVNASLGDENLRNAIDAYDNTARKEAADWKGWGCRTLGLNVVADGWQLRAAIDSTVKSLTKDLAEAQAAHTKTFAQLQEAYNAMNNTSHEALAAGAKEVLDYLIAHPGHGLTSELAREGAKRLRRHIEHGLPAALPLRALLDLALSSGVNAAHEMWDAEVTRTRDEATTLRKRLDQWVAWGCRAACLNAAPDEALRSEIDKALPMWRRDTPRG